MKNRMLMAATVLVAVAVCIVCIPGDETDAADAQGYEAYIGSQGYSTLANAVSSVTDGTPTEIVLASDVTLTASTGNYGIKIDSGSDITIDLNGHEISADGSTYALRTAGSLTIKDSVEGGSVESRGVYVEAGGSLKLESGTLIAIGSGGGGSVFNNGTFVMSGGTLSSQGTESNGLSSRCLVNNSASSKATITGGNMVSALKAITNNGSLTMSGVTVTATSNVIENYPTDSNTANKAFAKITNCDLSSTGGNVICNGYLDSDNQILYDNAELDLDGGTLSTVQGYNCVSNFAPADVNGTEFKSGGGIESEYRNVTLTGCTFTNSGDLDPEYPHLASCIAAANGATVTVYDCSFETENYGFYVFNTGGKIIVNGGTYVSTSTDKPIFMLATRAQNKIDSTITVNSGEFDGIVPDTLDEKCGLSINGGTFTDEIPDSYMDADVTVSENADGNKVVGEPISITVVSNGSPYSCEIAKGGVLPSHVFPTEQVGYTYAWDGKTLDELKKTEFTSSQVVTINVTLDPPTVFISGDANPEYGESTTLTANRSHGLSGVTYTYQWYRNGQAIDGATNQTYPASESGSYTVKVKASDGTLTSAEAESLSFSVAVGEPTYHHVYFTVDGATVKTVDVIEGGSVDASQFPEDPSKVGYTFEKWANAAGQNPILTNVQSDIYIHAEFDLNAPTNVGVSLSGPLYEGGSIVATVTAEHELVGVTFVYMMKDGNETSDPTDSGRFTINSAGQYEFAITAYDGTNYSETVYIGPVTVSYTERPYIPPVTGDDDYVPLPPTIVYEDSGSDDDSTKVAACAAAAVAAAMVALILVAEYRKK